MNQNLIMKKQIIIPTGEQVKAEGQAKYGNISSTLLKGKLKLENKCRKTNTIF